MKPLTLAADERRWTQMRKVARFICVHLRSSAAILLCTGCQTYVQTQTDLIEHSRKGIVMISQSLDAQHQVLQRFQQQQRRNLDDAFDADVRARTSLDAEWVIDHRIAYSLALDALNVSRDQLNTSRENDLRTLAAIELSLQQLGFLASLKQETPWTSTNSNFTLPKR